ncbi:MAG: sulfotransferase [Acidobacteria bacterium]|nr:sulfotransferase [Acidobacteriota bacterium]
MRDSPIFIFSAGWRSGSTMLQRLIMASGNILIWGEAGGGLNCLEETFERYRQMLGDGHATFRYGFGGNGAEQFRNFVKMMENRTHQWIASMNPPRETISEAMKECLLNIYSKPAEKIGFNRWGIKEVQSGIQTADFLKTLFPNSRFVFLVRNPFACMLSIKRRNWIDAADMKDPLSYFLLIWKKLASEFKRAPYGFFVRFEDLISDSYDATPLADYLGIKSLSHGFIEKSHADWKQQNSDNLSFFERNKIRRLVGPEMKICGY